MTGAGDDSSIDRLQLKEKLVREEVGREGEADPVGRSHCFHEARWRRSTASSDLNRKSRIWSNVSPACPHDLPSARNSSY